MLTPRRRSPWQAGQPSSSPVIKEDNMDGVQEQADGRGGDALGPQLVEPERADAG